MERCSFFDDNQNAGKLEEIQGSEKARISEHLKNCTACRSQYSFDEALFAHFQQKSENIPFPENLTQKIMARIMKIPIPGRPSLSDGDSLPARPFLRWLYPLGGLGLFALLLFMLVRTPAVKKAMEKKTPLEQMRLNFPVVAGIYNEDGTPISKNEPFISGKTYFKKSKNHLAFSNTGGDEFILGKEEAAFSVQKGGIKLLAGNMWAKATKRKKGQQPLKLLFPTGVVRVLGTVFKVTVLPDRAEVGVNQGRVTVSAQQSGMDSNDSSNIALVRAGFKRSITLAGISKAEPFKEANPFEKGKEKGTSLSEG
ncbi:FecR domain-containing protein [Candidatus Riflebacteria bacterium]